MPSDTIYKTIRNNKALMIILMFIVMGLSVFALNYTTEQLEGFYIDSTDYYCEDPDSQRCKDYLKNML